MAILQRYGWGSTPPLTSSSAAPRARTSASPVSERAWLERVVTSRLSFLSLLKDCGLVGWSGKMSPVSCHRTEDGTLVPSSGRWGNSGMGSPPECLTRNTSEFHSAAVACSLSDILETGDLPQRYFLSATACRGILRRAGKRGKALPTQLHRALQAVAEG